MANPFEIYLKKIEAGLRSGQATEHTYRPALEMLLESLADGIAAANDPKHIACGAPDFIVERRNVPLGYIETKEPGADLDKAEKSDQLKRYREALNNLILTDYLEFRWYVNGQQKLAARLATIGDDKKLIHQPEGIAATERLLNEFYQTTAPAIETPRELAVRMAQLAKLIRELAVNTLQAEGESAGALHQQFKTFQEYLLPNLKPEEFADIYAQTMAYGLFAARINAPRDAQFNRSSAYEHLAANRFLRKLFLDVGEELESTPIAPFLDDLASLLARADLAAILQDFGKRTRTEDPVVHFYETFLAAYDPKLRESRGVYYTPEPAVQFIINSVDWLLRNRFDRSLGLADKDVHVLDPATGTCTFLYFAVRVIYDTLMSKKQGGAWQDYVHTQLLPRLFGFELLVAPYVIAHLKLGLLLKELGYQWSKDDRLRIYLTNALDEGVTRAETLGNLGWYISQEANEAAQVKKSAPIMVVTGNPPYSGHSANKGEWIAKLVRDYYFVDGQPLGERNPKWLQDDYVKFIRFAQWRIQQTGHGILAFITNHSYLDNPTFRGMRRHLLQTFDEIYVLDLHGNAKKKERTPRGGKDENIFDIQQGTAILLAVKLPKKKDSQDAALMRHAHLYGRREDKYAFLENHHAGSIKWAPLHPLAPAYFFAPQETKRRKEYERGWKIKEVMPVNSLGVTTARDEFAVAFERRTLEKRIAEFAAKHKTDAQLLQEYGLHNTESWNISKSRTRLRRSRQPNAFSHYNYRPFDTRWTYYDAAILERDRSEVLSHLHNQNNFALVTLRRSRGQEAWNFVFAGEYPVDKSFITSLDNAFVFPLYLYPNGDYPASLFDYENGRRPNLSDKFIADCAKNLGLTFTPDGRGDLKKTFGPEDVFNYAYAVFHSPAYRERYAEFLKIDFPRLPLAADKKLFAKLAAKGAELVSLHLLKTPAVDDLISTYPVAGSNIVERVEYEKKKVWINGAQYFGNVPPNVWELKIGGYQVCDKWLKDRKGRALSNDDLVHYQRMIVALTQTAQLMAEIDQAIPGFPLP